MTRVYFDLSENKILTYDKNLSPSEISEESRPKASVNLKSKRSRLEIEMLKFKRQLQKLEQAKKTYNDSMD